MQILHHETDLPPHGGGNAGGGPVPRRPATKGHRLRRNGLRRLGGVRAFDQARARSHGGVEAGAEPQAGFEGAVSGVSILSIELVNNFVDQYFHDEIMAMQVKWVEGDATNMKTVESALKDSDAAVHAIGTFLTSGHSACH